jgi:uncharacterized protein
MKKLLSLLAALFATAAFAADTLPVFNATLTVGKQNRFVLIGGDGKPSSWLQLGDQFEGYTLKAFDAKSDALDLERDGKVTRVTLAADAAVSAGQLAATPATLADAQGVLNKMHFEEMMGRMLDQQKGMMGKMFDQMAPKNLSPEQKAEFIAFQKKMVDQLMTSMGMDNMKDDMAKIYSEVFTKQELDGLGAFYSTPTGEALTEKQPVVQQKMQELMMPRIMAAMPKIQQMSKEFAQQQKAKRDAAKAAAAAAAAPDAPAPAGNP